MSGIETVKNLYERFPYPASSLFTPFLSAVRCDDLPLLNFESLATAAFGATPSVLNPRILVIGCGTTEAAIVAMANPLAHIVAVDFSSASIKKAQWFALIKGVAKRITFLTSDLRSLPPELGKFDLIIASGVLHHLENAQEALQALRSFAKEKALYRIMVYSYWSRELIYETKRLAKLLGINTAEGLRLLIDQLPARHPYRTYFELYQDSASEEGINDGYLHPCDQPFRAWELQTWLEKAGLSVCTFLMEPLENPERADLVKDLPLDPWKKLGVLELTAQLERNFTFLAVGNLEKVAGRQGGWHWSPAFNKSGSYYSRMLGKSLQVDISTDPNSLSPSERQAFIDALFLFCKESAA